MICLNSYEIKLYLIGLQLGILDNERMFDPVILIDRKIIF